MKCAMTKDDKGFKPVTMTMTFETQEELDAFATLCNTAPIGDAAEIMGVKLPKSDLFRAVGGNPHQVHKFLETLMGTPYMSNKYMEKSRW